MSSKSANDGTYNLTITFEVGTNQDIAAVDVQNRVSVAQSSLPADVLRNGVSVVKRSTSFLMVVSLYSPDNSRDPIFLSNYATLQVVDALARIPGVAQATVFGARDFSMRIWLDPERMGKLGVTARDVITAVQEQNTVAPAGAIGNPPVQQGQQLQYTGTVRGRLVSAEEFGNIIVRSDAAQGSLSGPSYVRVRDVARVELAAANYDQSAAVDGQPAAFVGLFTLPTANALETQRAARARLEELSKSFPSGVAYKIPYDTTPFVRESLKEVVKTLFEAAVLVLLVVYIFLGNWRATLIPMLVVPVSLVGTLALFETTGFTINTLTLFAMVLAIGLVVDDAIVVVEAIQERLDSHPDMSRMEATLAAMRDVTGPVIAIAAVLCAVFIPVAFIGGLTGQLYRQFAVTLAFSVALSALMALIFTPALSALMLRSKAERPKHRNPLTRALDAFDERFKHFADRYSRWTGVLARRWVRMLVIYGVITGLAAVLIATRPSGFLPEEDQGYAFAIVQLPPGSSSERTEDVLRRIHEIVKTMPAIQNMAAINGLNLFTFTRASNSATIFFAFKPWDERGSEMPAKRIIGELFGRTAAIRDAFVLVVNPPPIQGLSTAAGFELVIKDQTGGDLQNFVQVVNGAMAQARQRPELGLVFTTFQASVPQVEFAVDRDKAKAVNVPLSDVFLTLQTFLGGYYINDFNLFGRTYRVQAQADAPYRASPEDVKNLFVRSTTGQMIPLASLLNIKPAGGPEFIERYNASRSITLNGQAAPGYSSGQAADAMEQIARNLPPGFTYEWTGTTLQEKRAAGTAPIVFALAMVFVFLVLAALYESWVIPIAVIVTIPFAVFGAYFGLWIMGITADVYAQIALVMLIGLSAKNAILIVEYSKLAHEAGATPLEAAMRGARLRLRPILMTSFAFILGAVPLLLAFGAGASSRHSLGTAIVFGTLFATAIGIFFIPTFYVLVQRLSDRFGGRQHAAAAGQAPERATAPGAAE
jgi:HAE1 family hydrophobic/amphiphilic exporter-1/multidrug efflux pump